MSLQEPERLSAAAQSTAEEAEPRSGGQDAAAPPAVPPPSSGLPRPGTAAAQSTGTANVAGAAPSLALAPSCPTPPAPQAPPKPPHRVYGAWQTCFIIFIAAIVAMLSPLSANIFIPALPVIASAFGETTERINLAVTLYLVFQGITPMFWGAAADAIGRRPVYIASLTVYIGACIGLALIPSSSYGGLLVLRCIQAAGGACVIALGAGVIGDVTEPHERGSFFAWYNLGALLGPTIGPVLGGILSQYLGWRAIFWFLVILAACCLVPLVLFFPETLRSIVGNGSIPPPLLNMTVVSLFRRRRASDEKSQEKAQANPAVPVVTFRQRWNSIRPLGSLQLLMQPDVFLLLFFTSTTYLLFYDVLTAMSTIFKEKYGLTEIQIGLCYFGNGLGCLLGSMTIGHVLDHDFAQLKKTLPPETHLSDFPLERARFRWMPLLFAVDMVATIGFGWAVQTTTHLAVPIICTFAIGVAGTALMSIASTISIDLQPGRGSAITGSFNFVRCLLGAVGTATIEPLLNRVGEGWAFVIMSACCIAFVWMPLVVYLKGPRWRKERFLAAEANRKSPS